MADVITVFIQDCARVLPEQAFQTTAPYVYPGRGFPEEIAAYGAERLFDQCPGTPLIRAEIPDLTPTEEQCPW